MGEIRDKINTILITDAQSSTAGKLGSYLGKTATAPYGIYYQFPKETVTTPYIVFRNIISTQDNSFNADSLLMEEHYEFFAIGDNFESVQKRIFQLFDRKIITGLSNDKVLKVLREYISDEVWDEKLEVYSNKSRYNFKCLQTYTTI